MVAASFLSHFIEVCLGKFHHCAGKMLGYDCSMASATTSVCTDCAPGKIRLL